MYVWRLESWRVEELETERKVVVAELFSNPIKVFAETGTKGIITRDANKDITD